MNIEEITLILSEMFGAEVVQHEQEDIWQVETANVRLLVLLSEDKSWLRMLVPIAAATEAQSLFSHLLAANFESTLEVRYALAQNVLWGVYHHRLPSLTTDDCQSAIATLTALAEKGLTEAFNQVIEERVRQIIKAAKLQGQSLTNTIQTLERLYQEGMLGGIDQDPQERERFLAAWKFQLERLWSEVEVNE